MVSGDGSARLVNPSSLRLECGCIRGGAFYPAPLSKKRVFRISVPSPHRLHRKTNEYNPCLARIASFGTRLKSILLRSGQEGSDPQGHQPPGSSSLDLTVACVAASNPILLLYLAKECQRGSAKLELVTALYFPESRVSSRRGVSPSRGAQPSGTKEQVSRKGTESGSSSHPRREGSNW